MFLILGNNSLLLLGGTSGVLGALSGGCNITSTLVARVEQLLKILVSTPGIRRSSLKADQVSFNSLEFLTGSVEKKLSFDCDVELYVLCDRGHL